MNVMHVRPHQRLIAWQESYRLCLDVYAFTKSMISLDRSLCDQMRRCASSVMLNLAEGNAKRSAKEKCRYFETSIASLEELHCQLLLSRDLQYLPIKVFEDYEEKIHRVSFLVTKLRSSFL